MFDALFHHLTGFGCEFHRRYDEAVGIAHKGPIAPLVFPARDHVQHLDGRGHVRGVIERCANVLGGSAGGRVDRVEVHFAVVFDIPRHHRALQKVNVIKRIGDASRIVQIL